MAKPPTSASHDSYDLIVVGLGAFGSAALYHAARAGLRVLGIDRYSPPHELGSTHAESRITRLAVGEGAQYLPFVARSHEIWREIAQQTGEQLLYDPGGYIISKSSAADDARWGDFVARTATVAADAGIDFQQLSPADLRRQRPELLVSDDESVGFEPTAGVVLCERAVALQRELAITSGAEVSLHTVVHAIEPTDHGVAVLAGDRRLEAHSAIVAAGPWFAELALEGDAALVSVTRQTVFWFEVEDEAAFAADRYPFVMWPGETIDDYSAVFPIVPGGRRGLKILGEQFHRETTPDAVRREVDEQEIREFYERLVAPRISGVLPTAVDTAVCLYTSTNSDHFMIDHHPESASIVYVSACSGHGFKHSTAISEAIVHHLQNRPALDLSPFARALHRGQSPR